VQLVNVNLGCEIMAALVLFVPSPVGGLAPGETPKRCPLCLWTRVRMRAAGTCRAVEFPSPRPLPVRREGKKGRKISDDCRSQTDAREEQRWNSDAVPESWDRWHPSEPGACAERLEVLSYDTVWFGIISSSRPRSSHSTLRPQWKMPFNPSEPYWEPLTVIGYVAGRTSRLRLGTSVLILPYRNPIVTGKCSPPSMFCPMDASPWCRRGMDGEESKPSASTPIPAVAHTAMNVFAIFRSCDQGQSLLQGEFHQFSDIRLSRDRCSRVASPSGSASYATGHPARGPTRRWLATARPAVRSGPATRRNARENRPTASAFAQQAGRDHSASLSPWGSSIQFTMARPQVAQPLHRYARRRLSRHSDATKKLGIQNFAAFPQSLD